MSYFPRPPHTLTTPDLKLGTKIWHIYGIYPPFITGPHTITREPIRFSQHPKWKEYYTQKEKLVFDLDTSIGNFILDGNLDLNCSYNNNYWTKSLQNAEEIRNYILNQYNKNPDIKEKEKQRQIELNNEYTSDIGYKFYYQEEI